MNRKLIGNLGEAKTLAYFVENDYQVYLPFQENGEYDLIVIKDGKIQTVSVKSTSVKSGRGYSVSLRTVSRRKDNQIVVKKFNNTNIDLLAVYIQPEDRVVIINGLDIKATNSIVVK